MAESANARPNIRIEIHNNLMEVDEPNPQDNEGEDGEILDEAVDVFDCDITYPTRPTAEVQTKPTLKSFATGINIFDKEEQKKRLERAKRFEIDPTTIKNFTDENLHSLYMSLGITESSNEDVRFEAIHMYGTEQMNSIDVMKYFVKYAPESLEWISNNSCNVIWADNISAARALFYLSKGVKGMPIEGTLNDDDDEMKSNLLKNNNREIELDDKAMEEDDDEELSMSDIKISNIPPGYWRLGVTHDKSTCILLRIALKSDKKPFKAEKFNEYYKKYGNPNYGGMKGLISESKKAEFRGIFERNREINSKNPWGDLAKTWHKDRKTEEVLEEIPQSNPRLQQRLGFKRSQQTAFEEDDKQDEEKVKAESKIPRMRMYADEEEAKIKRKKALEALKRKTAVQQQQPQAVPNDLRNVIRKKDTSEENSDIDQEIKREMTNRLNADLGNKLMNRRLKFNNPTTLPSLTITRKNNIADVRERINVNKMSKQHRFHEEVIKSKRLKSPPPPQRHKSSRFRKYDYNDDNIEEVDLVDDGYSDEDDNMKTNSKVTVVIKKPKQPTVASTVWSRVTTNSKGAAKNPSIKDRLQLPKRSTSETRRHEVSSSSSDDSSSSDSSESVEEDNNPDDNMGNESEEEHTITPSIVHRPGFRSDLEGEHKADDFKSPLRIEINNDLYKK